MSAWGAEMVELPPLTSLSFKKVWKWRLEAEDKWFTKFKSYKIKLTSLICPTVGKLWNKFDKIKSLQPS